MSFKFFFVVFVLLVAVVVSSVLIGTLVLKKTTVVYIPSEQLIINFFLWADGSWNLKIKNDHSQNITLSSLFISISDVVVNSSLSDIMPAQGLKTLKSNYITRTASGVANLDYYGFIRLVYTLDNKVRILTKEVTGCYK